ncbi:hypothetical protein NEDG_00950 [Nematocida displodere]|uniref:Post-GPI attachment to proteins factor 3 n=1 Tax=Nematocida displodere TaxID=1805483 RepID=A0A177EBC7_9MICR|nr:hypothetical protein NEDG_00950 [Nematocida displodere]
MCLVPDSDGSGLCAFGGFPSADEYLVLDRRIDFLLWDRAAFAANQEFIRGAIRAGDTYTKYMGKYAFIRVGHIQELVSSLFSLVSLVVGLAYFFRVMAERRKQSQETQRYLSVVAGSLAVHSVCWLCSALFHLRDCYLTQCLDYLCAMLSILSIMYISLCRLYQSYLGPLLFLGGFFFAHAYYLLGVEFNFLYNSVVCGLLMSGNVILWWRWYRQISSQAHSRVLSLGGSGMVIASLFQVIDFGPVLFLIDSHSLWHVLAALYTGVFYHFLLVDAQATPTLRLPPSPRAHIHLSKKKLIEFKL